ncbi:hypothetical protein RhiirB3_432510 [Rhizophagus irregularis]|nr:hypothetical protein RhiirB3_432510 [Rhizophagus irregularis]
MASHSSQKSAAIAAEICLIMLLLYHKWINLGTNILTYGKEMLENIAGACQIFECWIAVETR